MVCWLCGSESTADTDQVLTYLLSPDFALTVTTGVRDGTIAATLYEDAEFWRAAAAGLLTRMSGQHEEGEDG